MSRNSSIGRDEASSASFSLEVEQGIPYGGRKEEEADEEECLWTPTNPGRTESGRTSGSSSKKKAPRRSIRSRRRSSRLPQQQQKAEEDSRRRTHECRLLLGSTAGFLVLVGALLLHNSAPSPALVPSEQLLASNETMGLDSLVVVESDSGDDAEIISSGVLNADQEEDPSMIVRMEDEEDP